MYFKHPEILYALFLLVIPILVHLFRLRKFTTTAFTNVKFLRKAVLQTRKSSQIKKFLVLCTRLLLLASIILAFSQPYFPPESGDTGKTNTVVYLDNSYSMQAKGQNGILLKRSIQDLLENLPQNESLNFFTNDTEFEDISPASLRNKLQTLAYSATQMPWKAVQLKAQNYFGNVQNGNKNFIAISDFQKVEDSIQEISEDVQTYLVKLQPENFSNVAIDSVFISAKNLDETVLEVELSASQLVQNEISIGLYDRERLLSRKTIALNEQLKAKVDFTLPSTAIPEGRIEIEDNGLQFDNQFYFSIDKTPPVNVVAIGNTEADYLERIYRTPEFNLNIFPENNIDYNILSQANLVILNEPEKIPFSLITTLKQLQEEQVFIIIIPGDNAILEDYNSFFRNMGLPSFLQKNNEEKLVTNITFDHPLYEKVFNDRVTNFDYPRVEISFTTQNTSGGIIDYENGQPFLYENNNIFVFTAPLNKENSNFKNSPLIVPTFYNMANLSISLPEIYHILGKSQRISIKTDLQKDEILKLSSTETSFIPLQQNFQNKTELILEDLPEKQGHYQVLQDATVLRTLSFNIDPSESAAVQKEIQTNLLIHSSIPNVFSEIESVNEVHNLWKWFVIFALFFLLTEMLILKFLK